MSYFNTTHETGQLLIDFTAKAKTQEERIIEIFRMEKSLSPSRVYAIFQFENVPITSIRRAITNLTNSGLLTKTTQKVVGKYGRPETVYTLNKDL